MADGREGPNAGVGVGLPRSSRLFGGFFFSPGYSVTVADFNDDGKEGKVVPTRDWLVASVASSVREIASDLRSGRVVADYVAGVPRGDKALGYVSGTLRSAPARECARTC